MRNTEFASIARVELETVTGGKKKCAPPPQGPQPRQPSGDGGGTGTSVEVATGTQGGAMIQQSLQGAMPGAPQTPRMI